jgi:hypothetical protein
LLSADFWERIERMIGADWMVPLGQNIDVGLGGLSKGLEVRPWGGMNRDAHRPSSAAEAN